MNLQNLRKPGSNAETPWTSCQGSSGHRLAITPLRLLLVLPVITYLVFVGLDQIERRELRQCKLNLRDLNTAAQMYSTDFGGVYPAALVDVVPDYLKEMPVCPSAGYDTYSSSYTVSPLREGEDVVQGLLERRPGDIVCRVYCAGHQHKDVGANQPAFTW